MKLDVCVNVGSKNNWEYKRLGIKKVGSIKVDNKKSWVYTMELGNEAGCMCQCWE